MNVADEIRRIENDLAYIKIQLSNVRAYGNNDLTDITRYADSPMIVTGAEFSNGSNAGTLKVGALTALLRNAVSDIAPLIPFALAEQDNVVMAAANVRYHVVLTSTPAIVIQIANANGTTEIGIGTCMKEADDTVHFAEAGMRLQNGVAKLHRRATSLRYIELASGCTITETGGALTLGIAAGVVYEGINRFTPFSAGAFDSNVADIFIRVYRDGGGGFTKQVGQILIDSDNYDDNSGGVAAITVNQYSVHFIYLHPEDEHVYCLYGRSSFKLAEAIAEQPYGDIPDYISNFGVLLGKIITKKGTAIFDYVQMVTDTFFTGTAATDHANLSNLPWLLCKHTGTANRYIGFDGGGAAQERTYAQVLSDLSAQADTAFDWNDQDLSKINSLALKEIVTPANPAAGYNKLYFKNDDSLYVLDSDGNEVELGAGGGGNHALLSATHTDTVAAAPVEGDIIYGNATPKWTKLAKGDNDEVLTLKAGLPSWEPAGGGVAGLWTLEVDEDFNDLADGNINGKGSYTNWSAWVANNAGAATTEVVDLGGGNKILRLEYDGGEAQCHLNWAGDGDSGLRTSFVIKIRARLNAVTNDHRGACTANKDAASAFTIFYFKDDASLNLWDGALSVYLDPYAADTWYTITGIFTTVGANLSFAGFVDGDYKTGKTSVTGSNSDLNRLNLRCYSTVTAGRQFDIDWIKIWRLNTE